MSAPVFVCPAIADAVVGSEVTLAGDEARHAVTVQRRTVGEVIDLVDGAGTRARGEIVATGERELTLRIAELGREADAPVVLVQALAKGGRDEQAVESATELGVTRIVPWAAARSIVQWRGPKAHKGRARWEALALAATKQSRRAVLPRVDALVTTRDLATAVASAVAAGERVLILHEVAAVPLATLEWRDTTAPVWLIVGPEGGISEDEVATLTQAGGEPVLLGPHVLRASTAGPAAMAALAIARGTWTGEHARGDGARGGLR